MTRKKTIQNVPQAMSNYCKYPLNCLQILVKITKT